MAKERLAYIDALRGFAILGVIAEHAASSIDLEGPLRRLCDFGGNGVQLFFVVSAFTIFMTYQKAVEREAHPIGNFFIRRLMRIAPVYWGGIILYTAVYGLASRGWRDGPELWHYPLHLTFTNLLAPSAMSSVVPGGWSISCEVLFYLTAPLWFILVRDIRSATIFTVIASAVGAVTLYVGRHYLAPAMTGVEPQVALQYFFRSYPSQLACFGAGMMLYYLTRSGPAMALAARPLVNLGLLAAAAVAIAIGFRHPPIIPFHHLYAAGFLALALALSQRPLGLLVNPATTFVGRISYSAYLLHFLVLEKLSHVIPQIGPKPLHFLVTYGLGLAITLPLSYVSFRLVEQRTSDLARAWIARRERAVPVTASQQAA